MKVPSITPITLVIPDIFIKRSFYNFNFGPVGHTIISEILWFIAVTNLMIILHNDEFAKSNLSPTDLLL